MASRCKVCGDAALFVRWPVVTEFEAFDILECASCGFHCIAALDADGAAPAGPVRALDHCGQRIARNAALLRRIAPIGGAVLDVGCGSGAFLRAIPEFAGEGIEPDPRYRRMAGDKGLSVGGAWPTRAFDAVTLWDVLEHVNEPRVILSAAIAHLKPGGALLLDTPNREGAFYRFGELTARLTRGRFPTTLKLQYSTAPFCHKQIFRARDLRRLLGEAGFAEVSIHQRFELSFPVDYYMRHFVRAAPLRRFINPIAASIIRLLPIRNKLIATARKP